MRTLRGKLLSRQAVGQAGSLPVLPKKLITTLFIPGGKCILPRSIFSSLQQFIRDMSNLIGEMDPPYSPNWHTL